MSRRELVLWLALAISVATNVALVAISMIQKSEPAPASAIPAPSATADDFVSDDPALARDEARMSEQMLAAFGGVSQPRTDGKHAVSLVRVLANPREFSGKKVELEGYFGYRHSAHGSTFLYATASDAELQMTTNALALKLPKSVDASQFDGSCIVEGIFYRDPDWVPGGGHLVVKRLVSWKQLPSGDAAPYIDFQERYRADDYEDFLR
ncbi:MAG: hypothetical protein JSS88_09450 [Actinobacteria bacterium]|nr:hypothetical protein [Actinomycetota bacterium]